MKTAFPVLFLSISCALPLAARDADVGVLVMAQNDVVVQVSGAAKAKRASAMLSLPENTRVQVGANSRAILVLYKDGLRFSLPAGCKAKISASGLNVEGEIKPVSLPPLKIAQAKILLGSRIAYGRAATNVLRRGEKIDLQSLAFGATLSDRPTFRWGAKPGVKSYLLQLWDENNKPIVRREVVGNTFVFPAELPALRPEADYLWSVTALATDKNYKGEGNFRVLAPDAAAQVKAEIKTIGEDPALEKTPSTAGEDDTLAAVLRAEIYRKYELFDEATAIYEALLAKNPDSIGLRASYAEILTSQERHDAAEEQLDMTKVLGADAQ